MNEPSDGEIKPLDKWTKEEFQEHMRINSDYNSAVVMAALYKKIYGELPKIGLSGFQGSAIEYLLEVMPEPSLKESENE